MFHQDKMSAREDIDLCVPEMAVLKCSSSQYLQV
jgi:hypothetical protein